MRYLLHYFEVENAFDVTIRYLSRINTGYEHLAKKFERALLTQVGRDGSEITGCLRSFFVGYRLSASENGLYELANMFCHVGPDALSRVFLMSSNIHKLIKIHRK